MNERSYGTNTVALPPRMGWQSLNGYVQDHLQRLETLLLSGVPYRTLVAATLAAGFPSATRRSIESAIYRARKKCPIRPAPNTLRPVTPPSQIAALREVELRPSGDPDVTKAIGREFRELVRPPRPGSGEPDLLF